MKKTATVNQFSDGIVQDLNPMTSKKTTLQSCLNGTYITCDGDELSLQNDMGNSKVYKIHLDEGFAPIGLCTYGGVAYIASYNPLTGEGQVGSFPSPQEDSYSQNWGEKTDTSVVTLNAENQIKSINVFYDNDTIIRPGDRFDLSVTKDSNYTNEKLISNTFNVDDKNKIKTVKNKAVSIRLCVADSLGTLHDITDTLLRFDKNGEVINKGNMSMQEYVNSGTIFKIKQDSEQDAEQSKNQLTNNYNYQPGNIYNYKISGNLYLLYKLNTLEEVNNTIEFYKGPIKDLSDYITDLPEITEKSVENGKMDLVVTSTYLYNSPDGYYDGTYEYGNKNDFDPYKVTNGIVLNLKKDNIGEGENKYLPFTPSSSNIPKYNDNLYMYEERYLIRGVEIANVTKLNLSFIPSTIYRKLANLEYNLSVDVNKLNSGDVKISQWRYYVNNDNIILNWGLETYPYTGTRLTDVKLEFFDLTKSDFDIEKPDYIYNAPNRTSYFGNMPTVVLTQLDNRKVYCVKLSYKIANSQTGAIISENPIIAGYKTLVTTSLYNELYNENIVLDFNNLDDSEYEKYHKKSLKLEYKEESVFDNSKLSKANDIITTQSGTLGDIKKNKTVDVRISSKIYYDSDLSEYPYELYDITELLSDVKQDKTTTQNYTIHDNDNEKVQTELNKNSISITSTGTTINLTGNLYSLLTGNSIDNVDITFSSPIMQKYPKFNSGDYGKNRRSEILGYSDKINNNTEYPIHIAYGLTYRELSGHSDHHGIKYIDVNRSSDTSWSANTMEDLHSQIFGSYWNYPEVMGCRDGLMVFNITDFINKENFAYWNNDKELVYFYTPPYNDSLKIFLAEGHQQDIDGESVDGNVKNWVANEHEKAETWDYYITYPNPGDGSSAYKMDKFVLWKINDKFYLIKIKNSTFGTNTKNKQLIETPDQFLEKMSNIYVIFDETKQKCKYYNPDQSYYNENYNYSVNITANGNLQYNKRLINGNDVSSLETNLKKIMNKDTSLSKYIKFDITNETSENNRYKISQNLSMTHDIPMEGMNNEISELTTINTSKSYSKPSLITKSLIRLKDHNNEDLITSKTYEMYSEQAYDFGETDDFNKKLSRSITFENGNANVKKSSLYNNDIVYHGSNDDTQTKLVFDSQPIIEI